MKLTALAGTILLSATLLLAACSPAPGAPPVTPPPPEQQVLTAAQTVGCIVGDALLGKSILTIAGDCGGIAEQLVVDVLADFGVNASSVFGGALPAQYASDPRVQASMAQAKARAALKHSK